MVYKRDYNTIVTDIIASTKLTSEQHNVLLNCLERLKNKDVIPVFEDMYKLYLNNYSMIELSKIYGRSARTIQLIFKNLGMNRDRFEAQKIAAKNRNYVTIRKSYKKTMQKRFVDNQLFGSRIEQFARYELNVLLNELIPESDIIVGINTVTKVGELDIPIVVLYHDSVYKYGIEIDGNYFHNEENRKKFDCDKINKLNQIGYKVFSIETKAYSSNKNSKETIIFQDELRARLLDICKTIKNDVYKI